MDPRALLYVSEKKKSLDPARILTADPPPHGLVTVPSPAKHKTQFSHRIMIILQFWRKNVFIEDGWASSPQNDLTFRKESIMYIMVKPKLPKPFILLKVFKDL